MSRELEQLVTELQERVASLEAQQRAPIGAATEASSKPAPTRERGDAEPTDRRQLLARAAALTAGAVAGGTALAVGTASPAAAAATTFEGAPGLITIANPGDADSLIAHTVTGIAVRATSSTSGIGVAGTGFHGAGVVGTTDTGIGVEGRSVIGPGVAVKGSASRLCIAAEATTSDAVHLRFDGGDKIAPPPGHRIERTRGEVVFDENEDLWLCVASGSPGVWRRLAGASTAGALSVLPVPVRVYDSRPGYPPAVGTKTPLAPGAPRACDLKANGSGVPAGAVAVLVSVVATQTTNAGGGFLSIYRGGVAWPGTTNLNWSRPNENVAVTTLTAVDANARCNLYASQSTHVVIDVLGYYR
jgi:hypothetical protein